MAPVATPMARRAVDHTRRIGAGEDGPAVAAVMAPLRGGGVASRRAGGALLTLCLAALLRGPTPCAAHGVLRWPTARAGMAEGVGRKIPIFPAPAAYIGLNGSQACDCRVPPPGNCSGPPLVVYSPGQKAKIVWDVGIGHPPEPGVRIALRYAEDESFQVLRMGDGTHPTDGLLMDDSAKFIGEGGLHTFEVLIPAGRESPHAQLQWIWQSEADAGFYLGCADVEISATKTATPFPSTIAAGPDATGNVPGSQVLPDEPWSCDVYLTESVCSGSLRNPDRDDYCVWTGDRCEEGGVKRITVVIMVVVGVGLVVAAGVYWSGRKVVTAHKAHKAETQVEHSGPAPAPAPAPTPATPALPPTPAP